MLRQLKIAILFLLVFQLNDAFCQKLYIRQYSTDDGLPQSQVFSIIEDQLGFIWFGTAGGLTKYDTRKFKSYTKGQGLISNVVRDIYQTSDGCLWLATEEGVSCLNVSTDSITNYSSAQGLGQGNVRQIQEDGAGNLWFATASGASVRLKASSKFINFGIKDGLPTDLVYALTVNARDQIILGTSSGLVYVTLIGETLRIDEVLSTSRGLIYNKINCLYFDSKERLWVGTPFGVNLIENDRITSITTFDGLINNNIHNINEDSASNIWFCTYYGVSRLQDTAGRMNFVSYDSRNGFENDFFYTMIEDKEHNYWFGSSKGASKLVLNNLISYTSEEGLSNNTIASIALDSRGNIYAGTFSGFSVLYNQRSRFEPVPFLSYLEIWDVNVDRYGMIWLGTSDGLHLLIPSGYNLSAMNSSTRNRVQRLVSRGEFRNGYHWVRFRSTRYLSEKRITDILIEKSGNLWISVRDVGIIYLSFDPQGNISSKRYSSADGLLNNSPWCIYKDHRDNIWVGLIGGGLAFLDKSTDKFYSFNMKAGLADNVALTLAQDQDHNLWIGSELGISRLPIENFSLSNSKKAFEQIKHYSSKDGLPDNVVNAIVFDDSNSLWLGTHKGIAQFDPRTGSVIRTITKTQGLIDNEIGTNNSLIIDDKDNIWAGTTEGLTQFPTKSTEGLTDRMFRIFITNLTIEDKSKREMSSFNEFALTKFVVYSEADAEKDMPTFEEVPFYMNNFSFEFVIPSYVDEYSISYKYRLLGFDSEWSKPTYDNMVRYTNLSNGEYTFEVTARNHYNDWSRPAQLTFRIKSPFWKSWWFILFCVMFIGLAGYTLYQYRVDIVNKRTIDLEKKVQHRTRQLIEQKNKAEKILDELKQTQVQLVHSEKMASLGQLVAGVAHEINNPITFVKANVAILEKQIRNVVELFNAFSDIFVFYDDFKKFKDKIHKNLMKKLEEIDLLIEEKKFDKFIDELPIIIREMQDGVDRTQKIVQNLRDFSRTDESNVKETDINECIDSTLNILKNVYKGRIKIHKKYAQLPLISCNPSQINQVLMNLLTNAFQSIPKEGEVWIKTTSKANNILVSIKDNGGGIPDEVRSRIFDPFFTTKPIGQGTGLGLSISFKIIEAHRGTIFFDTSIGKGTEFKITLPIRGLSQYKQRVEEQSIY